MPQVLLMPPPPAHTNIHHHTRLITPHKQLQLLSHSFFCSALTCTSFVFSIEGCSGFIPPPTLKKLKNALGWICSRGSSSCSRTAPHSLTGCRVTTGRYLIVPKSLFSRRSALVILFRAGTGFFFPNTSVFSRFEAEEGQKK